MREPIVSFTLTKDLSNRVKHATDEAILAALEACGAQAVSFAVGYATEKGVVDTGLLRNSLTYALAGQTAHDRTYMGTRPSKYRKTMELPSGRYEGVAPRDEVGYRKVYIGTNVKYAIYNELGWNSVTGKRHPARPYLRPALEHHVAQYRQVFETVLSELK